MLFVCLVFVSVTMKIDSIFLFGPSLHTFRILILKQLSMPESLSWWQVVMWSPRGYLAGLCSTRIFRADSTLTHVTIQ